MNRLLDAFLDLIYPPRCLLCHKMIESKHKPVCPACMDRLPEYEGADPRIANAERCVCTFFYQEDLRESFRRYKFHGRRWYARQYGAWMAVTIGDKLAGKYDLITWVPVSEKRRKKRGYDQGLLLCQQVAQSLGMTPTRTLEKYADNPAQSGLHDPLDRRANVIGVYRAYQPEVYRGKRVLLIDDIVTSGATLSECCRVLYAAGAACVVCAALATPPQHNMKGMSV